ncbi:left-right determination factor 1-like [Mustela lutreola]|uniref:left-right determination factor 1-like n=1 Tax=Mustela lutreola TaxID=9666 RepID=UPI0027976481|nr:left-right determination factor 1-like [Mustela lutreola]
MRSLWLCWALWALPLPGPGAALSGEHILSTLLRQLQLREAPVLDAGDVEELVTPAHVMAQYVALLQRSHGVRSRGKRFSQRFREVAGRWLASEASTHLLVFSMERRLPPNSELVRAVLRLFQEPVPRAALRRHERLSPHSARARVTVEWLQVREDSSNRTSLVDSRLVSLHESGWKAFDVTEAVTFWQQLSRPRQPLLLQVTVHREHLEPPGFLAYECVGACQQPPGPLPLEWPFLGPRQCIASETTSLPMIVSVKEGGRTRLQVVSLPNMRVQRCSCSWDGAPVPRKLEP